MPSARPRRLKRHGGQCVLQTLSFVVPITCGERDYFLAHTATIIENRYLGALLHDTYSLGGLIM